MASRCQLPTIPIPAIPGLALPSLPTLPAIYLVLACPLDAALAA